MSEQSQPFGLEMQPLLQVLVECHLPVLALKDSLQIVICNFLLFQSANIEQGGNWK